MNILIIGNGGREHALAWKIAQSPRADRVFVAPGNAGTDLDGENVAIQPTDFPALIKFAKENDVGLTVVGPEAPLAAGIVDAFEAAGLRVFGPAARPPPNWRPARSSARTCSAMPTSPRPTTRPSPTPTTPSKFLQDREDVPIVVKADGLAAGKGVVVCSGRDEAMRGRRADRRAKRSSARPATAW